MKNKKTIIELNDLINKIKQLHTYIDRYTYDVSIYGLNKAIEKLNDKKDND